MDVADAVAPLARREASLTAGVQTVSVTGRRLTALLGSLAFGLRAGTLALPPGIRLPLGFRPLARLITPACLGSEQSQPGLGDGRRHNGEARQSDVATDNEKKPASANRTGCEVCGSEGAVSPSPQLR